MKITDKMVLIAIRHMALWNQGNGFGDPEKAAREMLEECIEPKPEFDAAGNKRCALCGRFSCDHDKRPGAINYIPAGGDFQ